ncbi:MAG: hypothetical protein RL375_1579 [Pseudomonadota bacterium]|jgi:hypothetical protein
MTISTMSARTGEAVLSEAIGTLSREAVVIASGAGALTAGSVLGRITKRQAAAPIPTIVGTGTGVMSALTCGPDVQVGSYVITLLATSATAAFSVIAPDGTALPNGAVGTAYGSSHLSFSIANGGTMTTGDSYTVVVSAAGTPAIVGTGTGAMSSISLGKQAQLGTYRVTLLATSATAEFEVIAPNGSKLKKGVVGTAYTSDHINFSIANGGTMTVGDYYNIVVAGYTAPVAKLWDPTAVDGTHEAWGVLLAATDATSAAQDAVAITRLAEVAIDKLAWKSTVTAAQKAEAYRQLAARQIIARS